MEVEYQNGRKIAIYDGIKFVRDDKTGYYLSSRKIGGSRKRLHRYIYEAEVSLIPTGYHVHHIDGDKGIIQSITSLCFVE